MNVLKQLWRFLAGLFGARAAPAPASGGVPEDMLAQAKLKEEDQFKLVDVLQKAVNKAEAKLAEAEAGKADAHVIEELRVRAMRVKEDVESAHAVLKSIRTTVEQLAQYVRVLAEGQESTLGLSREQLVEAAKAAYKKVQRDAERQRQLDIDKAVLADERRKMEEMPPAAGTLRREGPKEDFDMGSTPAARVAEAVAPRARDVE